MSKCRIDLINIIGEAKCVRCGYSDIRALQIDHINGGGSKELDSFYNNLEMYKYYIQHPQEAKERLQILCANCNQIKGKPYHV